MLIVSCALIYDDMIRACAVSTVTAYKTGKFVWLAYSLTASHCSTEAHLAGVPFPRWFDSRLVLRQSWSARRKSLVGCGCKKIHWFRVLIKAFLVKKKGTKTAVLSRVAKLMALFHFMARYDLVRFTFEGFSTGYCTCNFFSITSAAPFCINQKIAVSWSVEEVQMLLSLIAKEWIQRELDGATRNEKALCNDIYFLHFVYF